MKHFIDSFIKNHNIEIQNFSIVSKVKFIFYFGVLGIIPTFIIGIMHIAFDERNYVGYFEIFIVLLQILNIWYFSIKGNIKLTANLSVLFGYLIFIVAIISGGFERTGIYWMFLFPLIVYVLGDDYAKEWIGLFIISFIVIMISKYLGLLQVAYNYIELIQAFFAFLIIWSLTYFYYDIIRTQNRQLLDTINELKKQRDIANNAVKEKSRFLANMSHEIRTPLNAMFGFIELLESKELDNETREYLTIIKKAGGNLLSIVNDILDFSKLEVNKIKIEKHSFNIKSETEDIYNLFLQRAVEKNIKFHLNERNLKYNIITDSTRLGQIISNLLSNAIKFTPKGKNIYLNIEYDSENELLSVEVIDEGIGIKKEKLNTIFEAFNQAEDSTTREYGGTGLGLTISYKLVELLGGELKVESEENRGSKFYFTIPAKKDYIVYEEISKQEIKTNLNYNLQVLLVEDNEPTQIFMKVFCDEIGIVCDLAKNGVEAVEKYKQNHNKYEIIFMDENMPKMNGIEAVKEIRKFEQENKLIPTYIIAMTANALSGDKERFLKAGMDYYLAKPIDIDELKRVLDEIFGK